MTARVKCALPDCERMILPATAQDTGGLCMPCYQGWGRKDWRPTPQPRVVHRDPYAGYDRLTPAQQRHARDRAIRMVNEGDRNAGRAVTAVACRTNVDLGPLREAQLACDSIVAPVAFVGARLPEREELLGRVEQGGAARWGALAAYAWCGDDAVVARWAAWRRERPPFWHASWGEPLRASHVAGWEVDEGGRRRELVTVGCVALVRRPQEVRVDPDAAVRVAVSVGKRCPACGRDLIDLLRLVELAGVVPFTTCPPCLTRADAVHGAIEDHGGGLIEHIDSPIGPSADEHDDLLADALVLGEARHPRWALGSGMEPGVSQLGGHPSWVQEASYPTCRGCTRTMRFVGQADVAELDPGSEGVAYAFVCRRCRRTATVYQST